MTTAHPSTDSHHQARLYEIRIKGHLDPRWSDWFDGLRFTHASDGTTIIYALVADQAALHGLLGKVRDLGLPLVAVTQLDSKSTKHLVDCHGAIDG